MKNNQKTKQHMELIHRVNTMNEQKRMETSLSELKMVIGRKELNLLENIIKENKSELNNYIKYLENKYEAELNVNLQCEDYLFGDLDDLERKEVIEALRKALDLKKIPIDEYFNCEGKMSVVDKQHDGRLRREYLYSDFVLIRFTRKLGGHWIEGEDYDSRDL